MNVLSFRAGLRCGALLMLLPFVATTARALQLPGPLVETGWLADNLEQVVVLDVRKDAKSFVGQSLPKGKGLDFKKLTGHIPGAVSVPWKGVVAKGKEGATALKGMLPPAERFTKLMRGSGVDDDSAVVIAGRGAVAKDQAFATRLYFTLKYFGHDNVALLNGGTAQWAKEGRPLAHERVSPQAGSFSVRATRVPLLASTADVEQAIAGGDVQLLDCRPEDFFYGLTYKRKFVEPTHKGHLAGAKNLPHVMLADNFGPAMIFPPQEIRRVLALKGVEPDVPSIAYCNTGVVASLGWFVLHELENNPQVRLYDGSMHAWSTVDPAHPVRTLAAVTGESPATAAAAPATVGAEPQPARMETPHLRPLSPAQHHDQLRRERRRYIDAVSGRYLFQPPWVRARQEMQEAYRDQRREIQQQRREALRTVQLRSRELLYGAPYGYSW